MSTIFMRGVSTRKENSDYEAGSRLTTKFLQQNPGHFFGDVFFHMDPRGARFYIAFLTES